MYCIEKSDVGSWLVVNSDTGETVTHYPTKVGAMNWINSQNQKSNSMNKKSNKIHFAVKSKYFSVYQAFKIEMEKIGYQWNYEFNRFDNETFTNSSCVYVGNTWDYKATVPMMSFSNPGDVRVFDLDSNFAATLEYAQAEFISSNRVEIVRLNDYTATVYPDRIEVGCQTFPPNQILSLFQAAKNVGLL